MIQKQTLKQKIIKADMDMVSDIYDLIHTTIKDIYKKYYSDEAVKFFLELHSKENISADILKGNVYAAVHEHDVVGTGTLDGDHIKRLFVLPQFQGQGIGTLMMDFLEAGIIKNYGAVWLDSSLPAGKFYHSRGYITRKYEEIPLENNKVLTYEIMCRNQFPIDPNHRKTRRRLVMQYNIPGRAERDIRRAAEKYRVLKVILFGSRARMSNHERSDIDIAVSGGDFDSFYWDIKENAHSLLTFDIVNLDSSISETLKEEIQKDGVVIYEKT